MNQPFYTPEQLRTLPHIGLKYLKTSQSGHIFVITLNRPEKRNAFHGPMAEEIAFALGYANQEDTIRCVVIRAEGPVFCAGADLISFLNEDREDIPVSPPAPLRPVNLGEAFAMLNKPSIAQIEGPVYAGGFLILAGVTFAYAVPEAVFSLPEVKRGLWPMQVMASLKTILPIRKILEMCITARTYTAGEAMAMGLISSIVLKEMIEKEVTDLAREISGNAPLAISKGIEAFRSLSGQPSGPDYRALREKLEFLLQSEDAAEGIVAFKEKRDPVWKNR